MFYLSHRGPSFSGFADGLSSYVEISSHAEACAERVSLSGILFDIWRFLLPFLLDVKLPPARRELLEPIILAVFDGTFMLCVESWCLG